MPEEDDDLLAEITVCRFMRWLAVIAQRPPRPVEEAREELIR